MNPNPCGTNEFFIQPCEHQACAYTVYTFWYCGRHNFLLPLQEFTRCLRGVSATLSFSQHFCMASPDTLSAACSIPSLLHGKTKLPSTTCSLYTPNFPKQPPSKITTTVQRQQILMSQPSLACCGFLSPYCIDRWQKGQQEGKDRLLSTSVGSSTQLLLIDSSKGSKAPFSLFSPTLFKLRNVLLKDFPSLPFFSQVSKDGEIRSEPLQTETGGWLSEV